MTRGFKVTLALAASAAVALVAAVTAPPVAQVDVFTEGPAPAVDLSAPQVSAAVSEAVDRIGPARALALAGAAPGGSAVAAQPVARRLLSALDVRRIGEARIRIRLASRDMEAARQMTDAVRQGLIAAGVRERLRIASATHGGLAPAIATLLAALAAASALATGVLALARHRRGFARPRVAAVRLRAVAST